MCINLWLAPVLQHFLPFTYHVQALLSPGHPELDRKFYASPFVVFDRELKASLVLLSKHLLGRTPYSSANEIFIKMLEPCQLCC